MSGIFRPGTGAIGARGHDGTMGLGLGRRVHLAGGCGVLRRRQQLDVDEQLQRRARSAVLSRWDVCVRGRLQRRDLRDLRRRWADVLPRAVLRAASPARRHRRVCAQCGGAGQPCCPGNDCGGGCCVNGGCASAGTTCPALGGTCSAGSCGTCGGAGQACCPGGGLIGGGQCTATSVACLNGRCAACGGAGEPCCGGVCTEAGLACRGGSCAQCGEPGSRAAPTTPVPADRARPPAFAASAALQGRSAAWATRAGAGSVAAGAARARRAALRGSRAVQGRPARAHRWCAAAPETATSVSSAAPRARRAAREECAAPG